MFRPILVESAEEKGNLVNISGSSIRKPCNLQLGLPLESHMAIITWFIRFHHFAVPISEYSPEEPIQTLLHALER